MKASPAEDAKTYMSSRQVPQLFESLMTGLMYHRPDDHLGYLLECIQKVKDSGSNTVHWNEFVEFKRSNSLPPISAAAQRGPTFDSMGSAPPHREMSKASPLPPIGKSRESSRTSPVGVPPRVPVVLVMGPPGCGKMTQCQRVVKHYSKYRWVHLSIGDMIRQQMLRKHSAEEKWRAVKELVRNGEMAPDEVTQALIKGAMKTNVNADGFLIEGYPRTLEQVDQFNRLIGRVDLVILLDCEEEMCQQRLSARKRLNERADDNERAVQKRVEFFKKNTLPVVHHFETEGKLVPLPGDRDADEVFYDITNIMDVAFYGRKPASVVMSSRSSTQISQSSRKPTKSMSPGPSSSVLMNKDEGRRDNLPQAPIIFVMGGPGSGKGLHSHKLTQRFPGLVHLSMGDLLRDEIAKNGTASDKINMLTELVYGGEMAPSELALDLLLANLRKHKSAKGFLIEGFPRDKVQLEQFNKMVGGLTKVILLDCDEDTLVKNVEARQAESNRQDDRPAPLSRRIDFYKNSTLPLVKYFHDHNKLVVLSVDKHNSDDVHTSMAAELNFLLHADPSSLSSKGDSSDEKTSVDELIEPEVAHTTGRNATADSRDPTDLSKNKTNLSKDKSDLSKDKTDLSKDKTDLSKERTDLSKDKSDLNKDKSDLSKERTDLSQDKSDLNKDKSDLSKDKSDLSKDKSDLNKDKTDLSKDKTDLSKDKSGLSKDQTDLSKDKSDLNKSLTNFSKDSTDLSEQLNKEATYISKQATQVDNDEMAELKGKKVIFVVGGPGCGKGTQCAKIVDKYGFCHLSSGDLLREEVQSGSERGKELNAIMESGALVSMDVVLTLLKEAMVKNKSANGFLIDGYPRELEQGTRFEAEIMGPACVLYFEVPDEVMVERLLERAKTSGRVDDNEETIKKRLKTFHEHADKVLSHYEGKKLLCKIDARGSVDDIFSEVVKGIDASN